MSQDKRTRIEKDTLGPMEVPVDALYAAQTARAIDNFPISGWPLPQAFLRAVAQIKASFAAIHGELGLLPSDVAEAIVSSADEVVAGQYQDAFPLDIFQTGSGTSSNMNVNEVLATLATRRLPPGSSIQKIHPNDHVNLGQSSNDVIPAAIRIAARMVWKEATRPAALAVKAEFYRLADLHHSTVTLGRTHLMDAVPTTYGRVFDAWARRLEAAITLADTTAEGLASLPLGGTAVGTGMNANPAAVAKAVARLSERTGILFDLDLNPAVGISSQEAPIAHADALSGLGRVLSAICNDLRLRSSGPFGGLAEIRLKAVQPGSSIMPGKVNPVIPEAVIQVALQVEGFAHACRASAAFHQLDLSHANPLIAWNLDTMSQLLARACGVLVSRCLTGLTVNEARSRAFAESSPAMATSLAQAIGYEKAAEIAKKSEATGESVAQIARRLQVLPHDQLEALLDLDKIAGRMK